MSYASCAAHRTGRGVKSAQNRFQLKGKEGVCDLNFTLPNNGLRLSVHFLAV